MFEPFNKQIEETIAKFEKEEAGLPDMGESSLPKYASMSVSELSKKTPEELAEASYAIAQYAFYIQRLLNKYRSWQRWAYSKLEEVSSSYLPEIDLNYGWNACMQMAKNDPDPCKKLNKFIRETNMKIDRLREVPRHLEMISSSIKDIRFCKTMNNN